MLFSLGTTSVVEQAVALEKLSLRPAVEKRIRDWIHLSPAMVLLEAVRAMEERKLSMKNICSLAAHPMHREDPKAAVKCQK